LREEDGGGERGDVEGRRRGSGGAGADQLCHGDKIRGVELGTRTRWLTEEEEEERIAKASTAGAKSVVNFLQGGHQFEMKADIPMSIQQREEARKKKMKDEEDAVLHS
jgi:hypothetical protein